MDLAAINFQVETAALKGALDLVSKLGDAVQALGEDVKILASADTKASAAALLQAKARRENAAAAKLEASATQSATKTRKDATEAVESSTKATKENVGMLQRQKDIFDFMGQGFSKGQSSILATAKATGQWSTELESIIQAQRRLQGGDPFDKSLGAIVRVRNEYAELRDQMRMAGADVQLTSKQYRELTRAKLGIIEVMKSQGKSFAEIRQKVRDLNEEYIRTASVNNQMLAAEKQNEMQAKKAARSSIDAGIAANYLTNELARAENALQGLNSGLQVSTSNRLLKFEQQLKLSGIASTEARIQLEKYRRTLELTDKLRTEKGHLAGKTEEDRKVDYLARGLAPQISDVIVSLQGGMNPFSVLMQQGMQVRDLMQLSGVEAERMQEAFRKAGQGMVTTTIAAAGAIGSMLVGALADAGKMVTDFVMRTSQVGPALSHMKRHQELMMAFGNDFQKSIAKVALGLINLIPLLTGGAIAAAGAAFTAWAVGLYQVIQEENNLAKVLALNAGNLNMSQVQAIELAKSYDGLGISTGKAMQIISESAKAGQFTAEQLDLVIKSASDMEKYLDVSIEDTVKSFAKLKDEPVKAMIELAKTTGMIPAAVVQAISELERQGKTADAVALAMKTLADVNSQQVNRMKEDYNSFSLWIINFASSIKNAFADIFKDLFYKADPNRLASGKIQELQKTLENQRGLFGADSAIAKQTENQIRMLSAQLGTSIRMADEQQRLKQVEQQRLRGIEANNKAYESGLSEVQKLNKELDKTKKQIAENNRLGVDSQYLVNQQKNLEAKIANANKPAKTPKTPQQQATDSVYKKTLTDVEKLRDAALKAEVAAMNYSDVQKAALDIFNDPAFLGYYDKAKKAWVGYTEDQKIALAAEIERLEAQRLSNEAIEQARKSSAEVVKTRNEQVDSAFKELDALKESLKIQNEEADLLAYDASLIGMISTERSKALEIRKIELDLEKQIAAVKSKTLSDAQKEDQISVLQKTSAQRIANVNTAMAQDAHEKLLDSVTDAITTALFEGGKAGSKKLRDLIVAELRDPITVFVKAQISDFLGGGSSNVLGGLMSAGQALLSGGGISGALSASGMSSVLGAGSALSGVGYGTSMASQQSMMLAAQEYGMSTRAMGALSGGTGSALSTGLTGVAGYAAYRGLSGGYEMSGPVGDFTKAVGTFAGLLGSGGVFISAIAGLSQRAFGRKLTQTGISGSFAGGEVSGVSNYNFEKGGWFRSDKRTETGMQAGQASEFTQELMNIKDATAGLAKGMGLDATAIENFTGQININLKGLKGAEAAAKISEEFQNLQARMLESTPGFEAFKQNGESAVQTMQRLNQEALNLASAAGYSADTMATTIRDGMLGRIDSSDLGGAIGDILLDSVYNALAQGFAEQITSAITNMIIAPIMTAVITGGNVAAVVNATTIAAVRKQATDTINAFRELISDPGIQSLFAEMASLGSSLGRIISGASKTISVKSSSMRRSYASTATAATTAADTVKDAWEDIFNSLTDQIRELKAEILGDDATAVNYSQAAFNSAIAQAQAGNLDAAKQLPDLTSAVLELAATNSMSLSDLRAVQGTTLGALEQTRAILASRYGFALPAFDVGTNYVQKDMIAQIHEGEAIVPKAYNPAAGGSAALNTANLEASMQTMIALMSRMQSSMQRMDRNLDQVSSGGNVLRTEAV